MSEAQIVNPDQRSPYESPWSDSNRALRVLWESRPFRAVIRTPAEAVRVRTIQIAVGNGRYYGGKLAGWTSDRYMPRIKTAFENDARKMPFDFFEVVATLAPRPFLAVAATKDNDFDVSGVRDVMQATATVYELHGKRENVQAIYPDSLHDFPTDARRQAYEFLAVLI
jgi:hypothetical protein